MSVVPSHGNIRVYKGEELPKASSIIKEYSYRVSHILSSACKVEIPWRFRRMVYTGVQNTLTEGYIAWIIGLTSLGLVGKSMWYRRHLILPTRCRIVWFHIITITALSQLRKHSACYLHCWQAICSATAEVQLLGPSGISDRQQTFLERTIPNTGKKRMLT